MQNEWASIPKKDVSLQGFRLHNCQSLWLSIQVNVMGSRWDRDGIGPFTNSCSLRSFQECVVLSLPSFHQGMDNMLALWIVKEESQHEMVKSKIIFKLRHALKSSLS